MTRRVVVVGAGGAGLAAAIRLHGHADVVLVTKGSLGDGSTRWAQGGIAAATGSDDSAELHARDTVAAGAGLTDPAAARLLAGGGAACIRRLRGLGLVFDGGDEPHRGLEAAHSVPRVLHAGGDATGAAIARVLVAAIRDRGVRVREHCTATEVVLAGGRVVGLAVRDSGGDGFLAADAVLLATGGAGALYRRTTNPDGATADGQALAARAGAVLADLEFMQFHPTALAVPGSPLVSEAVRGEGAVLLDASGHRFMTDVHPRAELAPRDVVARGIAAAMQRQGGAPVLLDATGVPSLAARFPTIDRLTRDAGLDWTRQPVPVTPAAHYWMGGVLTDADGRTSVPGLRAVGEVARTGVHGANRLASNSLLEALVYAERAAAALLVDSLDHPGAPPAELLLAEPAEATGSAPEPFTRAALQELMWERVGLVRDADGLATAATALAAWRAALPCPRTTAEHEDANLLLAAALLVGAAAARTESRGAHARRDHPRLDPEQAAPRLIGLARTAADRRAARAEAVAR